MKQDRFDELMRDAERTYHHPPEPPLDAMWRAVEPALDARPWRAPRAVLWGALAATLVIGFALGRLSSRGGAQRNDGENRLAGVAPAANAPPSAAAEPVTDRYLSQTAALLIALPSGSGDAASRDRLSARAAELLVTTRLLLDSPGATDPRLRGLLEDLELVLAQIARLPNERGAGRRDLDLIRQALDQHDVIPRLREAVSTINASDD